jgi:hypothetical protein
MTKGPTLSSGAHGHVSKRSLASGHGHDRGDAQDNPVEHQTIPFSANVTILSGRSPQVVIDANGVVQTAIQATVYDGTTPVAQGHAASGGTIIIGDLSNAGAGLAMFRSGSSVTATGSGGTWTFNDTLPSVTITNASNKDLEINDIRIGNSTGGTVDFGSVDVSGLTFHISRTVAPTGVDIENLGTGAVLINGDIDNPIGTTSIRNLFGTIRATHARGVSDGASGGSAPSGGGPDGTAGHGHYSIIGANILDLETLGTTQDIGQSSPRVNVDYFQSPSVPVGTTFTTGRASTLTNSIFLGRNQFFTGERV